jgi:hypothetical protein
MDNEKTKVINVLQRVARAAGYTAWVKREPEAARFCVSQYNKVLSRLTEIEPDLNTLFTALPDGAAPEVVRMAARELVAYFEDEAPERHDFNFVFRGRPARWHARGRCVTVPIHCD